MLQEVKCTEKPDPTQKMGKTQGVVGNQTHNHHKYLFIKISGRERVIWMPKCSESHFFSLTRLGITHNYKSLLKLSHSNFPDGKNPWPKGKPETYEDCLTLMHPNGVLYMKIEIFVTTPLQACGIFQFLQEKNAVHPTIFQRKLIHLTHEGKEVKNLRPRIKLRLFFTLPFQFLSLRGWESFRGDWKKQNILPLSQT